MTDYSALDVSEVTTVPSKVTKKVHKVLSDAEINVRPDRSWDYRYSAQEYQMRKKSCSQNMSVYWTAPAIALATTGMLLTKFSNCSDLISGPAHTYGKCCAFCMLLSDDKCLEKYTKVLEEGTSLMLVMIERGRMHFIYT